MHRRTDLDTIRATVNEIVAASPIARHVVGVALVPDTDGDGDEYIRVEISLRAQARANDRDVIRLIEAIEIAVGEVDERFASVRFPDAA